MNPIRKKLVEAKLYAEEFLVSPSHIVVAVQLPTRATELIVNTALLIDKIEYLLNAYDDEMKLKANQSIKIVEVMIVWGNI